MMEYVLWLLLFIVSIVVVIAYPSGLVAVESRNIKDHQFRMLTGTIGLGGLLFLYGLNMMAPILVYDGLYLGAYSLLRWLILGLGVSGLALSLLAVWSMYETAWDLHRRAGMFGMISGTVTGLSCLISLGMHLF
jgi:uncharacterized membrane protein YozB (DUF420 family)